MCVGGAFLLNSLYCPQKANGKKEIGEQVIQWFSADGTKEELAKEKLLLKGQFVCRRPYRWNDATN